VQPNGRESLPAARFLRTAGEFVLFALATLSAWPFGGADYFWEYVLSAVVALLATLWAAHAVVTRRFRFKPDLVSGCLAGLVLLSVVQFIPLPVEVVRVVSPTRVAWHTDFVPERLETLPGEPDAGSRPAAIPLSVDPFATRTFAAQVLGVFVVYATARNWLASKAAFRRLAWAVLANGVLLAAFALGQFFSSKDDRIYWTIAIGTRPYGPFVCRNHYPDFLALCIGLAIGLLLSATTQEKGAKKPEVVDQSAWDKILDLLTSPVQLFEQPVAVAASLAVGLMAISIPFSLSRGGLAALAGGVVLTWILGRWRSRSGGGAVGWGLTLATAMAAGLLIWFGADPIQKRFANTLTDPTAEDRPAAWAAGLKQLPGFWAVGAGNGAYRRVEPLGRVDEQPIGVYDHAHNEYVEAAVEGGVIRLGLTLLMVIGVLTQIGIAYLANRERSGSGLLLGAWFGLAVLALHAVTDFAIHVPAVAVLAATAAGFAVAVGTDPEFQAVRRRVRKRSSSNEPAPPLPAEPQPQPNPTDAGYPLGRLAFAVLFPVVGALVTLDARARSRGDDLRVSAERVAATAAEDRFDRRIRFIEQQTRVSPGDPSAWFGLAQAHLDAAHADRSDGPLPPTAIAEHVLPALRALRTSRHLCPLIAPVHARFGVNATHFQQGDPPRVYLERAKRLLPTDPDIWVACGREALKGGDSTTAQVEWRRALELSPKVLPAVLRSAAGVSPQTLRDRVLPDDPVVMVAAANALFPDRKTQTTDRRLFLERAADPLPQTKWKIEQLNAVAVACEELNRPAGAREVFAAALCDNPNDLAVRSAAARWFERMELYDDAIPHLEWLAGRPGPDKTIDDRLDAARHGAKLKRAIEAEVQR
jgi:O-antigen ligase/tetratricopeptide (TPR) repeat protein